MEQLDIIENELDTTDPRESEYIEAEKTEAVKLERHQINSYSVDRDIETLIKWKSRKKLRIPDFQRDYVWDYNAAVKFIDTILIGLPTPSIFVFKTLENNEEIFTLVDGLQRITTVENFKKGKWKQKGKKERDFNINLKSSSWYKKKYSDLSESDSDAFDEYQFVMTIFEMNSNNLNAESAMFSLFERINTGSEDLSSQEIRNAVYNGNALKALKEISQSDCYKSLIDKDKSTNKRAYDLEVLCRAYTYLYIFNRLKYQNSTLSDDDTYIEKTKINNIITTSKTEMINLVLKISNDNKIDYISQICKLNEALNVISQTLNKDVFYGKKRGENIIGTKIHELFMEALLIAVVENDSKIFISREEFNAKKIELLLSDDFYEYFVQKSTSKENILKRVEILLKIIKGE